MIAAGFCGVDTVPAVTIRGDREAREAMSNGYRVAWTACHFGGRRPWLVCPECGGRRLELYPHAINPTIESTWCRECLQLGYWSRLRADWLERRRRVAERIRERLSGLPDLSKRFPPRPSGMHRETYRRLRQKSRAFERLVREAEAAIELRAWVRNAGRLYIGRREEIRSLSKHLVFLRTVSAGTEPLLAPPNQESPTGD